MNINIGQKILSLRKQNNLTQEQLSEILNVSNAAISKWESGVSYPDIETLPNIAKIFKVSIDSLFEFDIQNENLDELIKKAEDYRIKGKTDEVITTVDEALKSYPNDLNLNLTMASALLTKSLNQDPVDKELARLAIKYYDKSLILDKDGKNSESIIQSKSYILGSIGEYEEANKLLISLKQDRYIVQIADNLIKMGKFDEGMNKLQIHLNDIVFSFAWLSGNLKKCFDKFGKSKESYDITKMVAYFREFMTLSDEPSYYDLLSSKDFIYVAIEAYKNNDEEEMWKSIEKSVYHAMRFDSNPSFKISNANFLFGLGGSFYNGNTGASEYIIKKLKNDFVVFENDQRYLKFINQLKDSKQL